MRPVGQGGAAEEGCEFACVCCVFGCGCEVLDRLIVGVDGRMHGEVGEGGFVRKEAGALWVWLG